MFNFVRYLVYNLKERGCCFSMNKNDNGLIMSFDFYYGEKSQITDVHKKYNSIKYCSCNVAILHNMKRYTL